MTENKRFEWCEEIKGNFVDEYVKDNITGKSLDEEDMFHLLNEQEEEIQELKQRNKRQYERLKEITDLMMERDWKSLEKIVEDWEESDRLLQAEWGTYGE